MKQKALLHRPFQCKLIFWSGRNSSYSAAQPPSVLALRHSLWAVPEGGPGGGRGAFLENRRPNCSDLVFQIHFSIDSFEGHLYRGGRSRNAQSFFQAAGSRSWTHFPCPSWTCPAGRQGRQSPIGAWWSLHTKRWGCLNRSPASSNFCWAKCTIIMWWPICFYSFFKVTMKLAYIFTTSSKLQCNWQYILLLLQCCNAM